ncbi:MAG: hypothetical protein U9O98_08910 [Asgard group archaeon]|nr:hypothetical protein [Asgard group archaeon]
MKFFKRLFSKNKDEKSQQKKQSKKKEADKSKTTNTTPIMKGKKGVSTKAVNIDDFYAPTSALKEDTITISVKGMLPDLGWQVKEGKVEITDDEIVLIVIGKRKRGIMAGQALKPYNITIDLPPLDKGKYTIKAYKGTNKTQKLEVK